VLSTYELNAKPHIKQGEQQCTYRDLGLGLCILTPLSPTFQFFRGSFIGGGNRMYEKKTTDLPQVTAKLHHIMLYLVHLAMSWILTYNFSGKRH